VRRKHWRRCRIRVFRIALGEGCDALTNAAFSHREVLRFQTPDRVAFLIEDNSIHQHHASGDAHHQPGIFRRRRRLLRCDEPPGKKQQRPDIYREFLHQ
jgi:hypothetical protein